MKNAFAILFQLFDPFFVQKGTWWSETISSYLKSFQDVKFDEFRKLFLSFSLLKFALLLLKYFKSADQFTQKYVTCIVLIKRNRHHSL